MSEAPPRTGVEPLRIVVVVLSLDREPWRTMEAAQTETWAHPGQGFEIFHLQGITKGVGRAAFLAVRKVAERVGLRRPLDRLIGRFAVRLPVSMTAGVIKTRTFEYWIGTSAKTHAGLKYLARHEEFDYLVRTNSSTYLHVPRLLDHLLAAPRTGYYAGANRGEAHAQGTLIVLSNDVARALAADPTWEYDAVDDVALGASANRSSFALNPLNQVIVPESSDEVSALPTTTGRADFIFRFKNRADRLGDATRLRSLHAAFLQHHLTRTSE